MDHQIDTQYEYNTSPDERALRRAERIAKRLERQHQRRLMLLKRLGMIGGVCLVLCLCTVLGVMAVRSSQEQPAPDTADVPFETPETPETPAPSSPQVPQQSISSPPPEVETPDAQWQDPPFSVSPSDRTITIGDELSSEFAIVIDLSEETILAQKNADVLMNPASMTKILTILVAAEHVTNLDDYVTIDLEITDYCYIHECSVTGLVLGEKARIIDLFYGTILPSGGDAALALARYVSGSHEAFVELMNEKAAELGLSETAHFTNCVGLYHKNHTCTVYDIAMILRAAMENDLCRKVLTTKIYQMSPSPEHPEGISLSNWFLRRIEDYVPDGMDVIGAKTGYVPQAGNCAASIAQTEDDNYFICVTGKTTSSKQCIQDHIQLYTTYMGY